MPNNLTMNSPASKLKSERPEIQSAILSHAAWPTWTSGLLLFGTLWLPLCQSCSGTTEYPIARTSFSNPLDDVIALAPYGYGLFLAMGIMLVTLFRTVVCLQTFSFSILCIGSIVASVVLYLMYQECRSVQVLASQVPIVLIVAWTLIRPVREWNTFLIATVLSNWVSVAFMFELFLRVLLARAWYSGFFLAQTALLATLPAAWVFYARSSRDLVDRRLPIRRVQISMRQILLMAFGLPLLFTYYGWLHHLSSR
ncbi:MAG: hypothetical protein ABL921_15050 [Pirellula sp.]